VLGARPAGAAEHRQGIAMMLTLKNWPWIICHWSLESKGNRSDWLLSLTSKTSVEFGSGLKEILLDSPDLGGPCTCLNVRKQRDKNMLHRHKKIWDLFCVNLLNIGMYRAH
jgi:hypothetical protein